MQKVRERHVTFKEIYKVLLLIHARTLVPHQPTRDLERWVNSSNIRQKREFQAMLRLRKQIES